MAGCQNHNCFIERPKGQGTNGPCHCLRPLGKENQLALKRRIQMKDRALKEARQRFKEHEMDVNTAASKHHRDFIKMLDEAIEI